ncbi:MAG TPA: hypothetical protein VF549_04890 [Solirubrobacteraceae bacterium]|jgi:hypothetical protein
MVKSLVLATVAVAAGAPLAAGVASGPQAHSARLRDFPTFLFGTFADEHLRGSIAVVQRSATPKATVFVSVHGLAPSSSYHGTLTAAGCGGSAKPLLDLFGIVNTGGGEDDFFAQKTGRLKARLARGKTFHLFKGDAQIACARANRVR